MSTDPSEPFRRAGRLLVQHSALVIPIVYAGLILLGMFHMVLYFLQFRLNALDFAEPSDFLLAPLADPLVIAVSIAPFFLFDGLRRLDLWLAPRWRKWRGNKPIDEAKQARVDAQFRSARALGTALWILAFSMNYADWRADRVEQGKTSRVRVELTNGQRLGSAGDSTVALIGTTTQYAFFYAGRVDSSTGAPSVTVVPVGNIARMDFRAPRYHKRS